MKRENGLSLSLRLGCDKMDYSNKVRQTCNMLLLMLDQELNRIEKLHKTGTPYWKRLRIRKRLVQSILDFAGEDDMLKVKEKLQEEFFKKRDKELV